MTAIAQIAPAAPVSVPTRAAAGTIVAALLTPDLRGRWGTVCQHGHRTPWPSRAVAQIALHHPEDWCERCAASVATP